jgi:hypothetical protein
LNECEGQTPELFKAHNGHYVACNLVRNKSDVDAYLTCDTGKQRDTEKERIHKMTDLRRSFISCYILFVTTIILGLMNFTWAAEPSQNINEKSIKAMIEKAEPLIEEITAMKFKERIKFRLVKREVVRDVLAEEFLPEFKNLLKGSTDDVTARQVETVSHETSQSILGKYSFIKKEFLIVPDNVESITKWFDIKDADFQDFVFLVVAHEMVHALDDQYFALQKKEIAMDNAERMQAFSALVEGHAVYVTNKIAERLKLSETANKTSWKSAAGALNEIDRLQKQSQYDVYVKGSEFVGVIIKKKGLNGVAEAFASPPVSSWQIMNPEEYFNPLPANTFDCSKLLEKVAGVLPTQGMQTQSMALGTMTLSEMLVSSGIQKKEANAIANDCLSGAVMIAARQTLKPKTLTAIALQFSSGKSATTMLAMSKKTGKADEAQFNAKLNSAYTVVKEAELKMDGFDSVHYRVVEKKINDVTTTEAGIEGVSGPFYVAVAYVNMQSEITEEKIYEILTSLNKERLKML